MQLQNHAWRRLTVLAKKDETVPMYIVTAQVPYVAKLQVTKLTVAICTDPNTCQLQVLQPALYVSTGGCIITGSCSQGLATWQVAAQ